MADEEQQNDRVDGREELRKFAEQEKLPSDPREWPGGKGKFVTFAEGDDKPYGEGDTAKIGPQVIYHDDGSATVDGKKVDNPEDYKGEPIRLAVERADGDAGAES
jgi:hypothetical protein